MTANSTGHAEGEWVELTVRVAPTDSDLVADVLSALAPGGVVEEPAIRPRDDADFTYDLLEAPSTLRGFFPAPLEAPERRRVRRTLDALPLTARLPRLRWRDVAPVDWVEEWRRFYQPIEVGERLLICPSWIESPTNDRIVLTLDSGAAFGTGQHPTTRLCLAALERMALEGTRVLDVGCGSGVLAIGAALLGAREVVGCDIDPRAVEVASANVEVNGVGDRMSLLAVELDAVGESGRFDVAVANISSTVTRELIAPIADRLAPGGSAILSGFLERDRVPLEAAAAAAGFEVRECLTEDGWCALVVEASA